MQYKKRREALKNRLLSEKLDGLLVDKKENVAYLCGSEGEGISLLITADGRDFVITDPRFKEEAQKGLSDFDLTLTNSSRCAALKSIVNKTKIKRLGFECDWLALSVFMAIKKSLKNRRLIPKSGLVEDLRIIKDAWEIGLIKESVRILKGAYLHAKDNIRPNLTGDALAVLIDNFMRKEGSSRAAFQTIVAQNPYSSYPHAAATDKPFGARSAVLVDMGAVYKGYNSDLTRCLFLGKITIKFKRIYNILKAAQAEALRKIRPGVKASELDRAARRYIGHKGYGKYFLHSLGHGVGLEIHESPQISKKTHMVLREGMVFTIEPGVYIPGWGGIRVEDMVLVTRQGCEVLTDDIPK